MDRIYFDNHITTIVEATNSDLGSSRLVLPDLIPQPTGNLWCLNPLVVTLPLSTFGEGIPQMVYKDGGLLVSCKVTSDGALGDPPSLAAGGG